MPPTNWRGSSQPELIHASKLALYCLLRFSPTFLLSQNCFHIIKSAGSSGDRLIFGQLGSVAGQRLREPGRSVWNMGKSTQVVVTEDEPDGEFVT